jgi:hypothetical protein
MMQTEYSSDFMQQIRNGSISELDRLRIKREEILSRKAEVEIKAKQYELDNVLPERVRSSRERTTAYVKAAGAKAAGVGKPPSAALLTAVTDLAAVEYPELAQNKEKARARARPVAQMAKDLMDAGMDSWEAVETAYNESKKDPRKPWAGLREARVPQGTTRLKPIEATVEDLKKTPPQANFYYMIGGKTYIALDKDRLKLVEDPVFDDSLEGTDVEAPEDEEDM